MQIPVLIEPVGGNGYRASSGPPLAVAVEAPTREEALAKLNEQLQARRRNGAEIVSVDFGPPEHPWMKYAGMLKDDPLLDAWKQDMAEYRRKKDEAQDAL